ncbi:MAG: HAD family hydrolase [Spirochaetota bacterium]
MKYKLVALDLDGTLLDDRGEISEKNMKAIELSRNKGVRTIITTGRSYVSAHKYIKLLNLPQPFIGYNGACIYENGKPVREITIHDQLVPELLKVLTDLDYAPIVYPTDHLKYFQNLGSYTEDFMDFSRGFESSLVRVDNLLERKWQNVIRISVIASEHDTAILHSELKNRYGSMIKILQTYFAKWNFWLFEILNKQSTKSRGLEFLCKRFNISPSEVIAVGDNENDLDMITWAGLGAAMRNSLRNVLIEADYVTEKTNNQSGVAEVIEKFILGN